MAVKCPRCGADNAERAEWCYLCEYPFSGGAAEPPAPEENLPAQHPSPYAPPGVAAPSAQAVPPPPAMGPGAFQPLSADAYGQGVQPPPPSPRGPVMVKALIGVLVALLVVVVGVGAYFLTRGKSYGITVPVPPGYSEAEQSLLDDFEETMKSSPEEIRMDEIYVDSSMTNFVIVAHMNIPSTFGSDIPAGNDPDEMEEWFYKHKDEWVEDFNAGIMEGSGLPSDVDVYEVERMGSGDAVLHMVSSFQMMDISFAVDTLWIIKGKSAFFIIVEGLNPSPDTVEFLMQNITFEEG